MQVRLRSIWSLLEGHPTLKAIGVLAGGTALAQAIGVAALPLLTRLYDPQDFSLFAVLVSITSILSVAASLRYELAIPLSRNDSEAINVLVIALILPALFGISLWVIAIEWADEISRLLNQQNLQAHVVLVPLGVWLSGTFAALQFWMLRKSQFGVVARSRLFQAVSGTGVQIGMGAIGGHSAGLFWGQLLSNLIGIIGLMRSLIRRDRQSLGLISIKEIAQASRKFKRFPFYSTLEGLANNAAIQGPIVVIAAMAIGPDAGFVALASRVMQAPMGLIGGAVSQVYVAKAPEAHRVGSLNALTLDILSGLFKSGVGPLIFAGIVAPIAFPLVFGEQWQRAGDFVTWMTPWLVLQFVTSPISMVLHVVSKQKTALALQIFGLALRLGAIFLAAKFTNSQMVEWYSVSGLIFYGIYFVLAIRIAGIDLRSLLRNTVACLPIISGWALLGSAFNIVMAQY